LRYADRVKELKGDGGVKKPLTNDDRKAKKMMLARDNNKSKIVSVDQKTGHKIIQRQAPAAPTLRQVVQPAPV
jgi:hypothetical protein